MKTNLMKTMGRAMAVGVLLTAGAISATADEATAAKDSTFTGTVTSVDAKDKMVKVHRFLFNRTFVLADNCKLALGNDSNASFTDLRDGQKVTVSYKDAGGVLVADRIAQDQLAYTGSIQGVDPASRVLTVRQGTGTRTFVIAGDCAVSLNDGHKGALDNLTEGGLVTVIYEIPNDQYVARRIEQTSLTLIGAVAAVDPAKRIIRTDRASGNKQFNIAPDCAIIVDGRTDARLQDLRTGRKFEFTYEAVGGVNVVKRIASQPENTQAAGPQASSMPVGQGY